MKGTLISLLLGLLAGLWEIAVRPFMPSLVWFYPLVPLLVLLLITTRRSRALGTAAVGGALLDLYAPAAQDLALVRLVVMVLFLDFFIHQWFTHRSLYAVCALAVIGRVVERLTAWIILRLVDPSAHLFLDLFSLRVFVWDFLAVTLGFVALALWTRRFLSYGR